MRWISTIGAIGVTALLLAGCGDDNTEAEAPDSRVVTVTGSGEVRGAPDTLTANLGVESSGADVSSAIDAVNTAAAKVNDALKKSGIPAADIRTQSMSLSPTRTSPRPGEVSTVGGYQASNTVKVTIRDLSKASSVLDSAIAAGGDAARLNGLSFAIDDDSKLMSDARARAFKDAKARAEQYAQLADDDLGGVVTIEESVTGQTSPTNELSTRAAPAVIEPGEQTVRVQVTVKWRLA